MRCRRVLAALQGPSVGREAPAALGPLLCAGAVMPGTALLVRAEPGPGDCGPGGATGQSLSLWHSSRGEGLGHSSAQHRDLGQASPPALSKNIGTPARIFSRLTFPMEPWDRAAGTAGMAGMAGTAARPTEPRLSAAAPARPAVAAHPAKARALPGAGGGPYLGGPPCSSSLPVASAAQTGAGELFSTRAGSVQTGAPRCRRRTRSAHFHLLLQVNKRRLAKGGAGSGPGLPQARPELLPNTARAGGAPLPRKPSSPGEGPQGGIRPWKPPGTGARGVGGAGRVNI